MLMRGNYSNGPVQHSRDGFALLVLLIAVAIGMLIYYIDLSALFEEQPKRDTSGDTLPWRQQQLLVGRGELIELPSQQQPSIEQPLRFNVHAESDGQSRGSVEFTIYADGTVAGNWNGTYYDAERANVDIMRGGFMGNIVPDMREGSGAQADGSELYFIAKGKFLVAKSNFDSGQLRHQSGDIYLTGWLAPDYSAHGKLTLTADRRSYEQFTWRAQRPAE